MRPFSTTIAVALFAVPVMLTAACTTGQAPAPIGTASSNGGSFSSVVQHPQVDLCRPVRAGGMRCHAKKRTDITPNAAGAGTAGGFAPADLVAAYNLPSSGGAGAVVALIDANDDPTAEADLAVYRAQFGLPPCTTANGCFQKVNENGQASPLPAADAGWSGEISLDLDMVSAACPSCKILLVEADSATDDDLGTAVNTAATMGAVAISNSYGGPEDGSVTQSSSQYYNHPGILVTASSGDSAFGANFPASSQFVLAVGGTSLVQTTSSSRGWSETAWNDGSSGCSGFIPKPSFQTDTGCSFRTVADVSAVADPNTGVAVYDSSGGGWNVYGGTSASSPLVAAIFALTGQTGATNAFPYSHTSAFNDVTSGSNGDCGGSYLCTAGAGYDGPTGVGTPNGALIASAGGATPPPPPPPPPPADAGSGNSDSGSPVEADSGSPVENDSGAPVEIDSGVPTPPDSGSGDQDSGAPGSGGTCSHPICSQGNTLDSSCDPCASQICDTDPFCCQVQWDSICVSEVGSICGAPAPVCQHSICKTGGDLDPTCDPCATDICDQDPYCCNTLWDRICLSEVSSVCGESCQ